MILSRYLFFLLVQNWRFMLVALCLRFCQSISSIIRFIECHRWLTRILPLRRTWLLRMIMLPFLSIRSQKEAYRFLVFCFLTFMSSFPLIPVFWCCFCLFLSKRPGWYSNWRCAWQPLILSTSLFTSCSDSFRNFKTNFLSKQTKAARFSALIVLSIVLSIVPLRILVCFSFFFCAFSKVLLPKSKW